MSQNKVLRKTFDYHNFVRCEQRWIFSGLRLTGDAGAHAHAEDDDATDSFEADIVAGLSAQQKNTLPKYFYDEAGSALFEEICATPEYYVTRVETALLQSVAAELARSIPRDTVLVEFGSGASDKTRQLLDAAPQISTYVPIDISPEALQQAVARLSHDYPRLEMMPLAEDFTRAVKLPPKLEHAPRVGFFPGSTIGNFTPAEAMRFLRSVRSLLGTGSSLIIGVDMIKDPATLLAAYDDALGVTARFNKNLLTRINRELGGDFDAQAFDHRAVWNAQLERMEMHLVSLIDQLVHVAGHSFTFKAGEQLHTESSHKFSVMSFGALACSAGWSINRYWLSPTPRFAIFSLTSPV